MQTELAGGQKPIKRFLRIAATVQPSPSRVRNGLIDFQPHGEIELNRLGRDGLDGREQTMAIRPIAFWPRRNASEGDLIELVPFPVRLEPGIEEVRAITEACGGHEGRVLLAKERLHHVHGPAEEVRSAGECGRSDGFQERALRYLDVDEVVEAIVGDCVWRVYY